MGSYYSFYLDKFSFERLDYTPADDSQSEYEKRIIQPGLSDESVFEVTEEPVTMNGPRGMRPTVKKNWTGKTTIFDHDKLDILRDIEARQSPVYFYAAGGQNVLWKRRSYVNITRSASKKDGLQGYDVQLKCTTPVVNPGIWMGVNLLWGAVVLDGYKTGWQDDDNNGMADGYLSDEVINNQFNNNELSVEKNGSQTAYVSKKIIYPVNKITITISVNISKPFDTGTTRLRTEVQSYNSNSIIINSDSYRGQDRERVNEIMNNSIYYMDIRIITESFAQTGDTAKVKYPSMRTDGISQWANH